MGLNLTQGSGAARAHSRRVQTEVDDSFDVLLKILDNVGFRGEVAEWLKATDCKSVLSEYAGSNPAPSTTGKN